MNRPVFRCPDCKVEPDFEHRPDCEVARCPNCGCQRLTCDCSVKDKAGRSEWTGLYPGKQECRDYGLWTLFSDAQGYTPVPAGTPGAEEDLQRLVAIGTWDKKLQRWVVPPLPGSGQGDA